MDKTLSGHNKKNTSKSNRYVLGIIIGIVSLNSIGFSIVLPLLPFLVSKYLPSNQVVIGMSALLSVFAACTFFSSPILGALSDRYGRKKILLISLLGSVAGFVIFGVAGALWVLFLGRIIDGLTAGNISTLYAYISDVTEPEERTKYFGYLGSAMGIGKLGGPALGGSLGSIDIGLPFYVTAVLIFISSLAVYFLLPESLTPEKRSKNLTLASINTFSHFKEMFSYQKVKLILVTGMFFYAGLGIFQFNFTIFLKDIYNWGPELIGILLTVVGVCDIFTRAILLPRLLQYFNEKSIAMSGLTVLAIGLALIMISVYVHSIAVVACAVIFIISGAGLFETTYSGVLSQSVGESNQGKLQGVNQSLQSANNMLLPLGAATVYFYYPGMLYTTASVIVLTAVFIYAKYIPKTGLFRDK
ncbi:MFS transporter [Flavobacterium pectinovorum]|uniref:MFS transporter n=1 Tax=Flavobacterium pectinovorum TaxID=29533 RepID=UPI00265ED6DD|nr:MFS transporter [Flavobacterium pectinovorum]WKL49598.1 MFS transporter [Flavobacterium pectinovorum]